MLLLKVTIEVKKSGNWSVFEEFNASDRSEASQTYHSLKKQKGLTAKRLSAEYMGEDGKFTKKTLSLKVFDLPKSADPDGSDGDVAGEQKTANPKKAVGKSSSKPVKKAAKPRKSKSQKAGVPKSVKSEARADTGIVQVLESFGRRMFGSLATQPAAKKTVRRPPVALPADLEDRHPSLKRNNGAYLRAYKDEKKLEVDQYVSLESISSVAKEFMVYVENLLKEEGRPDGDDFEERIFGFVIGALLRIERTVDFSTDRGRMMLKFSLEIFIGEGESVESFLTRLPMLLLKVEVREVSLQGARAFKAYDAGNIDKLKRVIRETFGSERRDEERETSGPEGRDEERLGISREVGIAFTDIVDSTSLNVRIGDEAHQRVIQHHARLVDLACLESGGMILKNLGDGFMIAFNDRDSLVSFHHALLSAYGAETFDGKISAYEIRVGGNFGQAIARDGDFFGSSVALAARISSKARNSHGCLPQALLPVLGNHVFYVNGIEAVQLKGFPQEHQVVHFYV